MRTPEETAEIVANSDGSLEIGCGTSPVESEGSRSMLLDIRDLPGVHFVQSATDLSNFADGSIKLIVTRDCLEHISWRHTAATLAEWFRVLAPGGVLKIKVPNVEHLRDIIGNAQSYGRSPSESHFEFFSRVAFGHQDYPENSHLAYFSPAWICDLLVSVGFTVKSMEANMIDINVIAVKP
jgi:predicted SAM-dependent methyltransferase